MYKRKHRWTHIKPYEFLWLAKIRLFKLFHTQKISTLASPCNQLEKPSPKLLTRTIRSLVNQKSIYSCYCFRKEFSKQTKVMFEWSRCQPRVCSHLSSLKSLEENHSRRRVLSARSTSQAGAHLQSNKKCINRTLICTNLSFYTVKTVWSGHTIKRTLA